MTCDFAGECELINLSVVALTLERYRDGVTPDNNW